ncbi:MAG TPA: hypothetical protein VGB77_18755 [Abditibacteriaceae bacterium]|jgi:hypothetical protein
MKRFFVSATLFGCCLMATAQPPGTNPASAPPVPSITLDAATPLLGGPTRVTLHLKDATAQAVVDAFSQQSGVPLRMLFFEEAAPLPKYTIDIENQPFWTALNEVCRKLQLAPQLAGDRNIQDLLPGNPDETLGVLLPVHPLVALTARELRHEHNFSLKGTAENIQSVNDTHTLYFNGWVLLDPKVRVAPSTTPVVTISEAVDDKGNVLKDNQSGASFVQSPVLWDLQINLQGRADAGQKLTRLKGNIKTFIVTKREVWEVPNLGDVVGPVVKTIKSEQGNETYKLLDLAQEGKVYEITMSVQRPPQAAPAAPLDEDFNTQQLRIARQDIGSMARLLDAKGRDIPYLDSRVEGENIILQFGPQAEGENAPGIPVKMVLDIPVEFRELDIPFEYKNLPLP